MLANNQHFFKMRKFWWLHINSSLWHLGLRVFGRITGVESLPSYSSLYASGTSKLAILIHGCGFYRYLSFQLNFALLGKRLRYQRESLTLYRDEFDVLIKTALPILRILLGFKFRFIHDIPWFFTIRFYPQVYVIPETLPQFYFCKASEQE